MIRAFKTYKPTPSDTSPTMPYLIIVLRLFTNGDQVFKAMSQCGASSLKPPQLESIQVGKMPWKVPPFYEATREFIRAPPNHLSHTDHFGVTVVHSVPGMKTRKPSTHDFRAHTSVFTLSFHFHLSLQARPSAAVLPQLLPPTKASRPHAHLSISQHPQPISLPGIL